MTAPVSQAEFAQLNETNQQLQRANQQLTLIHALTLLLESATDPAELQERLLAGLIDELDFPRRRRYDRHGRQCPNRLVEP